MKPSSSSQLFAAALGVNRRDFLKSSALVAAGLSFSRLPSMAGPFTREDFDKLVPADKKLRPEWVKSLTSQGERTTYRGAELKWIGMPVGGFTCGQLYLGGDGRLWHWDIFHRHMGTGDEHYSQPPSPSSPLQHGFAVQVTTGGGKSRMHLLDETGWNDVSFTGEYPVGYVEYRDSEIPITIGLEAFSPFTPLQTDDSSLPATILEFTVRNPRNGELQVKLGGWACKVGLERILPEHETRRALQSLWHYNFSPDLGPYRAANKPGRRYAMAGEAGLLMCTFPRTDWDYNKAKGQGGSSEGVAGYFNECMNGFEHQVAGHMIWKGLVTEGLAIEHSVRDRYHGSKRNPWNEVEYGDHYARSMASYGAFLAACGFEYHGPKGHIAFAPRLTPDNFRAPFTAAEGWGTFSQKIEGQSMEAEISLKHGQLRLSRIALALPPGIPLTTPGLAWNGNTVSASFHRNNGRVAIGLKEALQITAGQTLKISLN